MRFRVSYTGALIIFALFFCFLLPATTHAATLYWVGGNGDSVNTNANDWNTSDPGACNDRGGDAGAVPGLSVEAPKSKGRSLR